MTRSLLRICPLLLIPLLVAAGAAPPQPSAAPLDAKAAFERIKSLEGSWHGTSGKPGAPPVSITYRVTSGGSVVMETLFPGTEHEMITMYHMDRDRLVLTHYCAAGNQPRMHYQPGRTPDELAFVFDGAGNMKSDADGHMHEARMRILEDGRLESSWVFYENGKPAQTESFVVRRQG